MVIEHLELMPDKLCSVSVLLRWMCVCVCKPLFFVNAT